jgi:hypothetical protein
MKFTRHFNCNSLPITTPTKSNPTIILVWGGIGESTTYLNPERITAFFQKSL